MNQLRNEKGYSLLLTLMLVLLFSIMGAALIAMTFNGLTRNETRENTVQSVDLATKGEEFIVAELNKKTADFVASKKVLTNEVFNQEFKNLLDKYKCSSAHADKKSLNEKLDTGLSTGDSNICIESYTPYEESLTKMAVTFKSIGNARGKESVVRSTYLMGAQEVKESLKYSVSTFKKNEQDIKGGNLFLHGSSELKGNINVANNLFITKYSYGLGRWLDSTLPRAKNSKLYLENNIYSFNNIRKTNFNLYKNNETVLTYDTHVNSGFPQSYYKELQPIFTQNSSNEAKIVNIFEKDYEPLLYKNEEESVYYNLDSDFNFINLKGYIPKSFDNTLDYDCNFLGRNCEKWKYKKIDTTGSPDPYTENSNIVYNNDVYITGNTKVKFNNTIYINGDLIIGNLNYNPDNSKTYHDIELNGKTIYVKGKVRVQGVNLKANANLYVQGQEMNSYVKYYDSNVSGWFFPEVTETATNALTTRFYELTLKGLQDKQSSGSLIVFSNGKLQIANISEYNKEPSVLTGYFYSEGTMELYGVGSNLKIIGGVSANNLIFNAMRGESKLLESGKYFSCSSNSSYQVICDRAGGFFLPRYDSYGFEKGDNQLNKNSRLIIEYNKDILDTYSKNQQGLFTNISKEDLIDEVKLLDRKSPQ